MKIFIVYSALSIDSMTVSMTRILLNVLWNERWAIIPFKYILSNWQLCDETYLTFNTNHGYVGIPIHQQRATTPFCLHKGISLNILSLLLCYTTSECKDDRKLWKMHFSLRVFLSTFCTWGTLHMAVIHVLALRGAGRAGTCDQHKSR